MIINYNVCDHCGSQKQILSGSDNGVQVALAVQMPYEVVSNAYSKKEEFRGTFCDRDCLLSFIKENLTLSGRFKGRDEE